MKKLIQLANVIDGNPPEMEGGRNADDAGVLLLASVINDEEAEIAMMCSSEFESIEQIAENAGVKPDDICETIEHLAIVGILFCAEIDGVEKYHRVPWAPGICEHVLLYKRDEFVAKAFDNYATAANKPIAPSMAIGGGTLRTIPIKSSIKADTHTASYEELKTYLDQSDLYSKADCVCRLMEEILGHACEHSIEGMCIQIGPQADYYIRTGRGTRITREEAEQIILKAEREGLVHQIFNNEGYNKSTFVCNCCGCSCTSLRVANLFRVADANRSNFVAEVDPEKCVGCGACVENCNTNAAALGSSFSKEAQTPVMEELPYDTQWDEDRWDYNFKVRQMVNSYGTAPCKTKCPAHVSVQGYIRKAHEGNFNEALKIIKRDNPFPAVCGRICPHPCESDCTRGILDEAIAIDDIKKYIADKELKSGNRYIPEIYEKREGKIAVIGAGPAGLSCAYYAALEGFEVCVFEQEEMLGGMMTMGIPSFRLDNEIIDAEIDVLRQLGVTFKKGVKVGKDVTLDDLRSQGYNAFFLAIGAQDGRNLGIVGEESEGVTSGIDFLRNISLKTAKNLEGKTVVIGGGNVAIDVARASIRMGAETTSLYCLESQAEMPALSDEQEEAREEGITINYSWGPNRILDEYDKVTGVEFKRCVTVFDENHRFNPTFDENDTMVVECSNVLISVGQAMDWGTLLEGSKMELTSRRTLIVDGITLQTGEPDVFAGGDAVTGPKFAIDAIASGKTGAISIKRYLLGQDLKVRREREFRALDKENLNLEGFDLQPRQKVQKVENGISYKTFADLRMDLTDEQIIKETNRCLGCGLSVIDEYQCMGCGVCATKCEFDAIHLKRKYDAGPPADPQTWINNIISDLPERQKRIEAKNMSRKSQ